MKISLVFLNLWNHPTYRAHYDEINEYIFGLLPFLKRYVEERYKVPIEQADIAYPYIQPKNYDQIKEIDKWFSYYDNDLQLYIGYGLKLQPHGIQLASGYCEAIRQKGLVRPEDFCYMDMGEFTGTGAFIPTIYDYYMEFSRLLTHELDHRMLAYFDNAGWIDAVHKVPQRADVRWAMPDGSIFYSQRDPRIINL